MRKNLVCYVLPAMLALVSTRPAIAQEPQQRRFAISIGTESEKVSSGTIWLYSYSWYGLQKFQLATIENGLAVVLLDTEKLKREVDPHPNTDAYVLVVQIGEHLWYRTPDISPESFWTDMPGAISSLGQATAVSAAETRLILPSPVKRHITLLYPNGRPAANAGLTVSVYLWDQNHCAVHMGLPLGTFRTDEKGTIEVLAPLVRLYLEGIYYYENAGTGPAGVAYSHNVGMKLGPEETLVLKEQWELTKNDYLSDEVQLRVLTATGRPRSSVDIYVSWRTNTCGGGDRIGQTDSKGIAQIDLDPSFTGLELRKPNDESRDLTDDELRELFSKHKLTIRW
jgi:hypothetical protein